MRPPPSARFAARFWVLAAGLLAAWCEVAGAQPPSLALHSGIFDAGRQRLVVFGGTPDFQTLENQTWELTLGLDPEWRLLPTTGAVPTGRLGHAGAYDPVRDRMIVSGGLGSQVLDDVVALSLTDLTWTTLQPTGVEPSPRRFHSVVYDPARDRLVVFGGDDGAGTSLNDVWSLWLSPTLRWERMTPKGPPPSGRYAHTAVLDATRDRMIVFGGYPSANDIWVLSFADTAWSAPVTSGGPPAPRYGHAAIHDPVGDRMVVFGGFSGSQYFDDVWMLSFSGGTPTWSRPPPSAPSPSVRGYHAAVYDPTYGRRIAFGGTPTVTEPTWALSLGASMRWSPLRPLIEVAPPELVLPTVTVGDTVSMPFVLSNQGLEPLDVASFRVPTPDASVSAPDPPPLTWTAALSETLRVAPTVPGILQDSLVIVCNDPVAPRRQVPVRLDVRGLEFDARILGEPDSVALGASFVVVVTPKPGVTVEGGKLFYRIAGTSAFDSLTLTPLATDFIASVPATAVTERGVEYYARVENSDFSATQPATAPALFFTQNVFSPDAISAVVPRPTSGSDFLAGQSITVDVVLPDGAIFGSGHLYCRRGGELVDVSLPLTPTGTPGQTSATIPDSLVGPRGVEYRVEVTTLGRTLHDPVNPQERRFIRILVPDLAEGAEHPGSRYRLLSIPLDFGPGFSGALDALLSDQLGTYDPTRWRAYAYDPSSGENVEFSAAQAARFRPGPGRAFWLISRGAHRVDTKPAAGLSTSTAGDHVIALAPGWNLIGNPFAFPVLWADVVRDPDVIEDPIPFDPARGTIGDYADSPASVLWPFEGYFVYASAAATLRVPPTGTEVPIDSRRPAESSIRSASASQGDWQIRLATRSESTGDLSTVFGIQAGAAAGLDAFDRRKPPLAPGAWVRAAFVHRDWDERSGEFRVDLRGPDAEGETWEIEIRSGTSGEAVTVDLTEIVPMSSSTWLRLIDREQGTLVDWPRDAGSIAIQHRIVSFGTRPYRLAVVAGSKAYVASASEQVQAVPARPVLDQNAPNPFRLATRVRFALPRAGRARLDVFSVLGERVATLMDEARLEPGYHTAIWDGRTGTGAQAASGVYLVRLDVEGQALTRRVLLVR